jgi:hypothetical protein
MAPPAANGLSTADIAGIRESLAAGRRPKVVFTRSAGQIAGQLGQVVRLDDPKSQDDWIVVRFGRDELPFSPSDVAVPPKTAPARRGPATPSAIPAPREEKPVSSSTPPAPTKPVTPPQAAKPVAPPPADRPETKPLASAAVKSVAPVSAPVPAAADKRPAKAAKVKAPPGLTVTLAYADREWTVAAQQGQKALAKPYVIRPADALRMVSLLDVPGVHEAVEAIISAERADAEGQAQRLRAELAEVEARLSELAD